MDKVEVAVIGGGFGGMSAALVLGRAKHTVVVYDVGESRNHHAHATSSFLTQEGSNPLELRKTAREELTKYPTVRIETQEVVKVEKQDESGLFVLTSKTGNQLAAKRVILATGVRDALPKDVEGLEALWGKKAHMCPYCDAYEYGEAALAVIGTNPRAVHLANLLTQWTPNVHLFIRPELLKSLTHPPSDATPPVAPQKLCARVSVHAYPNKVQLDTSTGFVDIYCPETSDTPFKVAGIFITTGFVPQTKLAVQLGAEVINGGFVVTNPDFGSSVPGFAAVGDVSWPKGGMLPIIQVAPALGTGARAATLFSNQLIMERINTELADQTH